MCASFILPDLSYFYETLGISLLRHRTSCLTSRTLVHQICVILHSDVNVSVRKPYKSDKCSTDYHATLILSGPMIDMAGCPQFLQGYP